MVAVGQEGEPAAVGGPFRLAVVRIVAAEQGYRAVRREKADAGDGKPPPARIIGPEKAMTPLGGVGRDVDDAMELPGSGAVEALEIVADLRFDRGGCGEGRSLSGEGTGKPFENGAGSLRPPAGRLNNGIRTAGQRCAGARDTAG